MAREVIKRVGSRAYRYRVESYRDGGKVRAHWTYLGTATADGPAATAAADELPGRNERRAAAQTRALLVDAFERLAAAKPYATLTAGDVAVEAGVAHGTFYRYFKNKRAALIAALERIREAFERMRPNFDPPYGTLEEERARVRAWIVALEMMPASRGLLRAWFDALDGDAELRAAKTERAHERNASLTRYFEALARAGTIDVEQPEALATALLTLVDATVRSAVMAGALDQTALTGMCDVFDRAIFTMSLTPLPAYQE